MGNEKLEVKVVLIDRETAAELIERVQMKVSSQVLASYINNLCDELAIRIREIPPYCTPVPPSAARVFVESAFAYLNTIANQGVCADRSCLRCRIADAAFEVEQKEV